MSLPNLKGLWRYYFNTYLRVNKKSQNSDNLGDEVFFQTPRVFFSMWSKIRATRLYIHKYAWRPRLPHWEQKWRTAAQSGNAAAHRAMPAPTSLWVLTLTYKGMTKPRDILGPHTEEDPGGVPGLCFSFPPGSDLAQGHPDLLCAIQPSHMGHGITACTYSAHLTSRLSISPWKTPHIKPSTQPKPNPSHFSLPNLPAPNPLNSQLLPLPLPPAVRTLILSGSHQKHVSTPLSELYSDHLIWNLPNYSLWRSSFQGNGLCRRGLHSKACYWPSVSGPTPSGWRSDSFEGLTKRLQGKVLGKAHSLKRPGQTRPCPLFGAALLFRPSQGNIRILPGSHRAICLPTRCLPLLKCSLLPWPQGKLSHSSKFL